MADLSTLARPYAKAAFDFAYESNAINEWEGFLTLASEVVRDEDFLQLLSNPSVTSAQKAEVLSGLYDSQLGTDKSGTVLQKLFGKPTDLNSQETTVKIRNFILQLAENNRLTLIPQILTHFSNHKSEALKQIDAYVTTAYPLTDEQRTLIQTRLATTMNATVILHEEVDASLIAGATIKVGDKLVDDSVRGKLKQLKTQLTA